MTPNSQEAALYQEKVEASIGRLYLQFNAAVENNAQLRAAITELQSQLAAAKTRADKAEEQVGELTEKLADSSKPEVLAEAAHN